MDTHVPQPQVEFVAQRPTGPNEQEILRARLEQCLAAVEAKRQAVLADPENVALVRDWMRTIPRTGKPCDYYRERLAWYE